MLHYLLLATSFVAFILAARRRLYPKPYPSIPYNEQSASRLTSDLPELIPVIKATNEYSSSIFAITTQRLRKPIVQMLFPALRKPLINLEDPREIEDILLRRTKEFDKALMAINTIRPMFANATTSQYTTPEPKAQKRLWADVMSTEFLHKTAAPNIYKATLDLLELWRLNASSIYKEEPLKVTVDFQNAALDAIWVAVVGEEPGMTRYEINKLQDQIAGGRGGNQKAPSPPRGMFLKHEVDYIEEVIARNSSSPVPGWAQKLETFMPRHRRFRRTVNAEIGLVMRKAVNRFQRLDEDRLEADEIYTCMMDPVLRRMVLASRRSGQPLANPTKDQRMLDEMFFMLVGGYDSTANSLTWFVRYMESYPETQAELRAALKAAFPHNTPSMEDLIRADVPYLDAVCEEVFRLGGVAKGNLRQAVVDTTVLGCRIPKGAEIFMNYHLDHEPYPVVESHPSASSQAADAKKYEDGLLHAGHDLSAFEPRRWLVRDEEKGRDVFDSHALLSLAFGGGFRGCSGRKLAVMEFRMVVALLVLNFEFLRMPDGMKTLKASEKIFRLPDMPYARLRALS